MSEDVGSCVICGTAFVKKRKDAILCSDPCRKERVREASAAKYREDRETKIEQARQYRENNRELVAERSRKRYERDRQSILADKQQYYLENKDRIEAYRAANREALRASARDYYARNRDQLLASCREYRKHNSERRAQLNRAWRLSNPDWCRAKDQRRRAAKCGAEAFDVSARDIARLRVRQHALCFYCGSEGDMHLDHVLPLSRGGRHCVGNLVLACAPCNLSKHSKLLSEWRRDQRVRSASGL